MASLVFYRVLVSTTHLESFFFFSGGQRSFPNDFFPRWWCTIFLSCYDSGTPIESMNEQKVQALRWRFTLSDFRLGVSSDNNYSLVDFLPQLRRVVFVLQ